MDRFTGNICNVAEFVEKLKKLGNDSRLWLRMPRGLLLH